VFHEFPGEVTGVDRKCSSKQLDLECKPEFDRNAAGVCEPFSTPVAKTHGGVLYEYLAEGILWMDGGGTTDLMRLFCFKG
jgi:hypothetical protein